MLWRGRGSLDTPTCRACRSTGIRRTKKPSTSIGCQEPKWLHCWTCAVPMNNRAGTRYCSKPCQPSEIEKAARGKRDVECAWCAKPTRSEIRPSRDVWPTCSRLCQTAVMMFKSGRGQNPWPRTVKCRLCSTKVAVLSGRKNILCEECRPELQTHEGPCEACGQPVTSTYYEGAEPARYCSSACRNRSKTLRKHGRSTVPRFVSGTCLECGEHFTDEYLGTQSAMYCSRQCGKKAAKQRRRARKRVAFVSRVSRHKIYSRDHYVCHLCQKKTDPSKSVPHPNAPTIDHIVPLAKGGTHEPSNVATACFRCNCRKGDRGGLEQLLLIG